MTIRWLNHTADDGFVVEHRSIDGLFAEAARALAAMVVAEPDSIEPREMRHLTLDGSDVEVLLFDWLSELLWLFNGERWVWRDARPVVDLVAGRLTAQLAGEPFDPEHHPTGPEVKAITWHGFAVEQHQGCWRATVIVDI